jgi:hypothetical protein
MSAYPKAIEKLIGVSGVGFNNAKTHSEINAKIISFGYTDIRLDELLDLNSRTDGKYHDYERAYGEQLHVTRQLEEKLGEEIGYYTTYRKLAFRVFPGEENKGIRSQLGIDMKIKDSFDGIVEQCQQLYDTAIKKVEIMEGFSEFAVTNETFQERLNGLDRLRQLNEEQEQAKGTAMVVRKLRDDLYYELKAAWSKFITACRFVFKDNGEYLRILNVPPLKTRTGKSTVEPEPEPEPEPDPAQGDQADQTPEDTPTV